MTTYEKAPAENERSEEEFADYNQSTAARLSTIGRMWQERHLAYVADALKEVGAVMPAEGEDPVPLLPMQIARVRTLLSRKAHRKAAQEFEYLVLDGRFGDHKALSPLERALPEDFFGGPGGKTFLPKTMAESVIYTGALANGVDGRIWAYADGKWSPDDNVIRNRVVHYLGEKYQPSRTTAVEHIVKASIPTITLDPVTQYINLRNGLLDWETGELLPHDPEVMSTVQLHASWDPEAQCPEFDKFLTSVVPADVVDLAWELIGYMMFSGNPLHKAVMLTGTGRNGKGTFIRVLQALLGRENITAVTLQALATERFAPASLFGKLANIAGDIDGNYIENTAKFKGITGEDAITAEFKNKNSFEFTPYAVPLFSANKIPGSADATTGYLSRWVVIPFPNDFTGREDRTLSERLTTPQEIDGIAAKAIPALQRLMARGNFAETASSKAAMDDFMRKVDQVRAWAEERAELGSGLPGVNRTTLYEDYKTWASNGGYGKLKAPEFYDRLHALGPEPVKVRGDRLYKGIRLLPGAFPAWSPTG